MAVLIKVRQIWDEVLFSWSSPEAHVSHPDVFKQSILADEKPISILTLNTATDRPRDGIPSVPASILLLLIN